jgi:hypothetical protein
VVAVGVAGAGVVVGVAAPADGLTRPVTPSATTIATFHRRIRAIDRSSSTGSVFRTPGL